jgi:hypothetical protein
MNLPQHLFKDEEKYENYAAFDDKNALKLTQPIEH